MTIRSAFGVLVSMLTVAVVATAQSEPGVTDLTEARPEAIDVNVLTEALAIHRGTHVEPRVRLPVYFDFNSVELRPEVHELLVRIGTALATPELAPYRFSIEGHTDDVGTPDYNVELSRRRAATVMAFLTAEGISGDRLRTLGHGEQSPVVSNDSEEGRKRNRRVEMINLGQTP